MTGEFSTYECEQEMECGQKCERLYGHSGNHVCGGHREMTQDSVEVTVHQDREVKT